MSGCRNLIFHIQETRYDIKDIRELLEKNNLKFLGPGIYNPRFINIMNKLGMGDAGLYDLNAWHEAEKEILHYFRECICFLLKRNSRNPQSDFPFSLGPVNTKLVKMSGSKSTATETRSSGLVVEQHCVIINQLARIVCMEGTLLN
jgi:hypothetical protein